MNGPQTLPTPARKSRYIPALPVIEDDMPLLYEDDEAEELGMGEASFHTDNNIVFLIGTRAHFAHQKHRRVYSNLNLYYSTKDRRAYVSPDGMVVEPLVPADDVRSYRIGEDGPSPLLTSETLSARTAQQRDLDEKLVVYAKLGVAEYILIDTEQMYLKERLLLKRLQPDRTWKDERDRDGGITSQQGFRVIIDDDGRLRVVNARTGIPYARPDEAEIKAQAYREAEKARQESEQRVRDETKSKQEAVKRRDEAERLRREERNRRREAEKGQREELQRRQEAEKAERAEALRRHEAEKRLTEEAQRRLEAEERNRELEAELARLRAAHERP